MSIIFTNHARVRLQERGISEDDIIECIMHPKEVFTETDFLRRFRKGNLEAVVQLKGNHFIVVTVYFL